MPLQKSKTKILLPKEFHKN